MHKPIKFIYALLIITIVASSVTWYLLREVRRNEGVMNEFIANKRVPTIYACVNSLEIGALESIPESDSQYQECMKGATPLALRSNSDENNEYPYYLATCELKSVTKGDQFTVDIGHNTKFLFTSESSIDPTNGPYVDFDDTDKSSFLWNYTLVDNPSTQKHTINFNTATQSREIGQFEFRDFNFDGYLDLVETLYCHKNCYANIFIYDFQKGEFIKSEDLSIDADYWTFDLKNKLWSDHGRDRSADDYLSIRKFINNKWVLIESHTSEVSGEKYDKCTFEDGALIKGVWVKKTETVPYNDEMRCNEYGPSYSLETDVK